MFSIYVNRAVCANKIESLRKKKPKVRLLMMALDANSYNINFTLIIRFSAIFTFNKRFFAKCLQNLFENTVIGVEIPHLCAT